MDDAYPVQRVTEKNLQTTQEIRDFKAQGTEGLLQCKIKSIFCTDSHKRYIQFAQNIGIELHQIKRGKHKEGIYHIQHINAFHSKLKGWMYKFNGVSTKYLANYMYWFKWLESFNSEKDATKIKQLLVHAYTSLSNTKLDDFKNRQPIFA